MKEKVYELLGTMSIVALALMLYSSYDDSQDNTPVFKVSDCVQFIDPNKERWEVSDKPLEKILEVGQTKYHTSAFFGHSGWYTSDLTNIYISSQKFYKKVECPKE